MSASEGAGVQTSVLLTPEDPRLRRASVVMFNRTGLRDERIPDRIDRFLIASKR